MGSERRHTVQVDSDGVRTVETSRVRGRVWLLVAGIVLVGIALVLVVQPALHGKPDDVPAVTELGGHKQGSRPNRAPAEPGAQPEPKQVLPRKAEPQPRSHVAPISGDPAVAPHAQPTPSDAGDAAPAAAESASADSGEDAPSGIALFPPPGTKPIKRGIVVPDTFEVPPGYVRHYQTTDQGQQLPAILMFHPDYKLQDENGNPVPMPEDRVVPPEMAPPDLPIQILEVPEPQAEPEGAPPRSRNPAARGSLP